MVATTKSLEQKSPVKLTISLEQFAHALRNLSQTDLLTLETLVDEQAMETIKKSLKDTKRGKVKVFRA